MNRSPSYWGAAAALAAGVFLSSNAPIMQLGGLPWPGWPSWWDISVLLLLAVWAGGQAKAKPHFGRLEIPLCAIFALFAANTTLVTLARGYSNQYPIWAFYTAVKWFAAGYVINRMSRELLAWLGKGLLFGLWINALVCIGQKMGFVSYTVAFSGLQGAAGPWTTILDNDRTTVGEAIGVYSYSRIATGFFLATVPIALYANVARSTVIVWATLALSLVAILTTGSRSAIGVIVITAPIVMFTRGKLWQVVIIAALAFLLLSLGNFGILPESFVDDTTLRLLGRGYETYSDGAMGRISRQLLVFEVGFVDLILGVGLGNLGSGLSLAAEGLNMYRAHGFLFTYLGETGVIGVFLLAWVATRFFLQLNPISRALLLVPFLVNMFTDDFFIPSTQTGGFPLVFYALACMLTSTNRGRANKGHRTGDYDSR